MKNTPMIVRLSGLVISSMTLLISFTSVFIFGIASPPSRTTISAAGSAGSPSCMPSGVDMMDFALSTEVLGMKTSFLSEPRSTKESSSANGVQNPGVPMNVMLPESLEISLNVLSRPPIPFETFISLIYTTPGIVIAAGKWA